MFIQGDSSKVYTFSISISAQVKDERTGGFGEPAYIRCIFVIEEVSFISRGRGAIETGCITHDDFSFVGELFPAAAEGDGRESKLTVIAYQDRDVVEVVVLFDGSFGHIHMERESDGGTSGFHFNRVYIDVVFLGGCHRHRQI